ncbi:hypothetical protein VU10_04145, partial [Desulfobulbus sp. US1]|nr:hypothetical protein [Desulfobulbus sp. US1]
ACETPDMKASGVSQAIKTPLTRRAENIVLSRRDQFHLEQKFLIIMRRDNSSESIPQARG